MKRETKIACMVLYTLYVWDHRWHGYKELVGQLYYAREKCFGIGLFEDFEDSVTLAEVKRAMKRLKEQELAFYETAFDDDGLLHGSGWFIRHHAHMMLSPYVNWCEGKWSADLNRMKICSGLNSL